MGITLKVCEVQLCPWTKIRLKYLRFPSLQNTEDGTLRKIMNELERLVIFIASVLELFFFLLRLISDEFRGEKIPILPLARINKDTQNG